MAECSILRSATAIRQVLKTLLKEIKERNEQRKGISGARDEHTNAIIPLSISTGHFDQ
jgi:hypothetical protein